MAFGAKICRAKSIRNVGQGQLYKLGQDQWSRLGQMHWVQEYLAPVACLQREGSEEAVAAGLQCLLPGVICRLA